MKTLPLSGLLLCGLALTLSGCAVTHLVELPAAPGKPSEASVSVQDNRLDTTLKLQTIGGTGGGFMLLEAKPPITEALAARVKASYRSVEALQIGLERLELFNKLGFMAPDDMSCGIESTVKVGGGASHLIRTRVQNRENMSPMVTTMSRTLISQCLDAHAADIVKAR